MVSEDNFQETILDYIYTSDLLKYIRKIICSYKYGNAFPISITIYSSYHTFVTISLISLLILRN